ncbi:MAG: hypothetical protein ABWY14_05835 [Tardiphaga sp.]
MREIATRSGQRLEEGGAAELPKIGYRIAALVAGRAVCAIPLVKEEIAAPERGNASVFQHHGCKILVVGQSCRSGSVLRKERAAPGAERDGPAGRSDGKNQSGPGIDFRKIQTKSQAGKFSIDRLIGVKCRLASAQVVKAGHEI